MLYNGAVSEAVFRYVWVRGMDIPRPYVKADPLLNCSFSYPGNSLWTLRLLTFRR